MLEVALHCQLVVRRAVSPRESLRDPRIAAPKMAALLLVVAAAAAAAGAASLPYLAMLAFDAWQRRRLLRDSVQPLMTAGGSTMRV